MRQRLPWTTAVLVLALVSLPAAVVAAETTFTYAPIQGETVTSVSLRGTMNGWGETPFTRLDDGTWTLTLDLAPGEHLYKYFVNGQWPQDMATARGGGPMDPAAEDYVDDGYGGQNAVRRIGGAAPGSEPSVSEAPALAEGRARIHYHRPDGAYAGWGLHVWEDADEQVEWTSPLAPSGQDPFGLWWDVRLRDGARRVGFLVHRGTRRTRGRTSSWSFPGPAARSGWSPAPPGSSRKLRT